jgi:hypothetical protein
MHDFQNSGKNETYLSDGTFAHASGTTSPDSVSQSPAKWGVFSFFYAERAMQSPTGKYP